MDDISKRFKSFLDFGKHYNFASTFLSLPSVLDDVEKWHNDLKSPSKDTKISNDYRIQANSLYKKRMFTEAFAKMQESLRYARLDDADDPLNTAAGGCSLSVAYKNRAIYHLHDKKYDECIADVDMAVECGYQEALLYNVYQTKSQAYIFKHDQVTALDWSEKALKLFEKHGNVDPEQKAAFITNSRIKMEETRKKAKNTPKIVFNNLCGGQCNCHNNPITKLKMGIDTWIDCVCPDSPDCQDIYCVLNDDIEFRYVKGKGRGLFSKKAVKKGVAIFMDESFASTISKKVHNKKCHNCLHPLPSSCISCKYCTYAFFCKKECAVEGWVKFHRFECGFFDCLQDMKAFMQMTYRIFVQASPSEIKDVLTVLGKALKCEVSGSFNRRRHNLPMEGFVDGAYQAKNYYGLFHLDTGTRSHDLQENMAALTLCLRLQRLYQSKCESLGVSNNWELDLVQWKSGSQTSVVKTERRALQLALLLHHYKQTTNHNICRVQNHLRGNSTADFLDFRTGLSPARLYPVGALINHSHEPNIDITFDDYNMYSFFRPNRDVKAGEELTLDYDRKDDLHFGASIYFSCNCDLCATKRGMTDSQMYYRTEVLFCDKCGDTIPVERRKKSLLLCQDCAGSKEIVQVTEGLYQMYRKGLLGVRQGDDDAAHYAFKSCAKIRKMADEVPIFSSIVFISWMASAALHAKAGRWGKVVHYTKSILRLYDMFPRLKAYQFTGAAAKLLAQGLEAQISRFQLAGDAERVGELKAELEVVLKRGPSGEVALPPVSDGLPRGGVDNYKLFDPDVSLNRRFN